MRRNSITNIPLRPIASYEAYTPTENNARLPNKGAYKSFSISFLNLKKRLGSLLSFKPKPMTLTSLPKLYAGKSLARTEDVRAGWLANSPHRFGNAPERYTEAYKAAFFNEFNLRYPGDTVERAVKFSHHGAEAAMHELASPENSDREMADYASFILASERHAALTDLANRMDVAPPLPMSPEPPLTELGRGADGEMVGPEFGVSDASHSEPVWAAALTPFPVPPISSTVLSNSPAVENEHPAQMQIDYIKARVFMANVTARKMLVANTGKSKKSRKSFEVFSSACDNIYSDVFKSHYRSFRLKGSSIFQAATAAAERANTVTAQLLFSGSQTNGAYDIRPYAQDMLYKTEIAQLAKELFEETKDLAFENARAKLEESWPVESVRKNKRFGRKYKQTKPA